MRLIVAPTLAVLVALIIPAAAFAQSGPATSVIGSFTRAVPSTPTSNRCTNAGHQNPCWAFTQGDSLGAPWCGAQESHSEVPFFSPSDSLIACDAGPNLVEISCYFQGQPAAYGDNYEDHVIKEYSGAQSIVGHVPDFFVNLGSNNPPSVGIPRC